MEVLQNIPAEYAVLSGICKYGEDVYLDVSDILQESSFTVDYNRYIYACLKKAFDNDVKNIDMASIFSSAEEIGLSNLIQQASCVKHIQGLFLYSINKDNIRKLAAQIRKLEITRLLRKQLEDCSDKLLEVDGNEPLYEILGIAENAVFDFSSLLSNKEEEPHEIHNELIEYVDYLANNQIDQIGIPTGFNYYDQAIGGGLRPGTINVVGARLKGGKSVFSTNVGWYIANQLKIPVLNMDTEMTYKDHLNRLLAMASDNYIKDVETGKFSNNPHSKKKMYDTVKDISSNKVPYFHKSIAGMPFEEQLSVMRRWLVKNVGVINNKANPCLIVYDYLKLMTTDSIKTMQEYQALGFMMTTLHNFAVKYNIPILMLIQLNRDGINNEDTGTVSGSDRVGWLCSNLTLMKDKSPEEIEMDGPDAGNKKLVTLVARHGPGMTFGNYINLFFNGGKAQLTEGKTHFEIKNAKSRDRDS